MLVCSIVATVSVATLISLSSWLRLNMSTLVTRRLWRKLHVMNVFTIATAKILRTSTKRPTVGTNKIGQKFNLSAGEAEAKFRNIRTAYGRYQPTRACIFDTPADQNVWLRSALRSLRLYGNSFFCDRLRLFAIYDRLRSYGNQPLEWFLLQLLLRFR